MTSEANYGPSIPRRPVGLYETDEDNLLIVSDPTDRDLDLFEQVCTCTNSVTGCWTNTSIWPPFSTEKRFNSDELLARRALVEGERNEHHGHYLKTRTSARTRCGT